MPMSAGSSTETCRKPGPLGVPGEHPPAVRARQERNLACNPFDRTVLEAFSYRFAFLRNKLDNPIIMMIAMLVLLPG